MASTRDIIRRIKSVKSTKKVTKAMELVSAAKMRRAIEAVLKTRSYANLSWLTVLNLAKAAEKNQKLHELLKSRQAIKTVGIILITSNRGLCGGFNANIINKTIKSIKQHEGGKAEFVILGKKGAVVHRRFGFNLAAEFDKPDIVTEIAEVFPVAKMAIKDYLNGRYDKIMLAYTDFVSAAKQIPRVKQLLPIDLKADETLGVIGKDSGAAMTKEIIAEKQEKYFTNQEYIFEPNAKEVLDEMIPRLLEIQMFQAMLESNASEHSARMMAMRNASDAANDMIDDLTLTYNKARQANITREIAEIAGGAQALQN
ncbi:ATP synthase F1 subunit gamma [Candidatus Falkowbacteria bacterium RIFOXYC2_FULL_47_12]|uniref:ATP synthase gamma chain n=1 Tax=Candidatus Falkowbacteria bacterium RIFOXYC2_FULL_47_12 TaxID=1798004 RepID=A0A1F5TLR7_9BACT|nr:MAG: ATP synthase F1 subunit gamma [Candidatus Falkowbacteria bacterium RIFOXYC2_FULL_47_12]